MTGNANEKQPAADAAAGDGTAGSAQGAAVAGSSQGGGAAEGAQGGAAAGSARSGTDAVESGGSHAAEERPAAAPRIETSAPTPDIDLGPEAARLPGEHRGGFTRPPTAPVELVHESRAEPGGDPRLGGETGLEVRWATEPTPHAARHGVGGWALAFAIAGLAVSFFVGWGIPLGIIALVIAIVALRRPAESRVIAGWALGLGILSVLYSAGWILWAVTHPV
ncbi:hypothetical protein [Microbacterium sp.]|uniref:hypothetical protein n=1 Tax=Microbacterium sp. TaxID=51671 RepID=UPI003A8CB77C